MRTKGDLPCGPIAGHPITMGPPVAADPDCIVGARARRWSGKDPDAGAEQGKHKDEQGYFSND